MQLHYLLVVVVVSDVKVMSSTVAVTFAVINYSAITRVVNNYNIRTKPHFLNRTKLIPNRIGVFFKLNRDKKSIPHIPSSNARECHGRDINLDYNASYKPQNSHRWRHQHRQCLPLLKTARQQVLRPDHLASSGANKVVSDIMADITH